MKKLLAYLSLGALLLTGCGSASNAEAPNVEPAGPTSPEATEVASTEPSATPTADTSSRGNLIKTVGAGAGITNSSGDQIVDFVINSITVDAPCTGPYAMPAENGHYVVLDVSVKTAPAQPDDEYPLMFSMTGGLWSVIAPNGTTSNAPADSGATYNCIPEAEMLPDTIGAGEQATGKVVLDVVEPEGVLVYGDMTGAGSWEWAYPQG